MTLTGAAPAGGTGVVLSSTDPTIAQAPAEVTVPAGANSVLFTAILPGGSGGGTFTLEAELNGVRLSFTFTVSP